MRVPLSIVLGLFNLGLLGAVLLHEQATALAAPAADGILRGRGLQIVDEHGNVRASIAIHPAARQPDGSIYPETVLLRLATSAGRPVVKIAASEDGAGASLAAAEGSAYMQLMTREGDPRVVLVDRGGKEISKLP